MNFHPLFQDARAEGMDVRRFASLCGSIAARTFFKETVANVLA
jgi:hypothetical protein